METNLTENFFDHHAKAYETTYADNPGILEFLERAAGKLPPSAAILDVGCGTGKPVSSTLAAQGYRVYGIDRSQAMIDLCRAQVPSGSFEKADMLTYSPKMQFDAIFGVFVFFALSRRQLSETLFKFSRWLKPGGTLCLGVIAADGYAAEPCNFDSDGLFASDVDNEFLGEKVKISLVTRKGWKIFLEQGGFEIVETATYTFRLPLNVGEGVEQHDFIIACKPDESEESTKRKE
ncbi:hypothetical protein MMC10_001502 [Thelotrema lepadinum]|nr:hypothetical protein [Thelotrema lepadinum]